MKRMQIVDSNPVVFIKRVVDAAHAGYEIDENEDFSMFFNLFTVGMIKEEESAEIDAVFPPKEEAKKVVGRPPKTKG